MHNLIGYALKLKLTKVLKLQATGCHILIDVDPIALRPKVSLGLPFYYSNM